MASILLIGPGAIGATLAAWLAQDDRHDVAVAARTPFDSLEVQTPEGVIRAKPRVYHRVQPGAARGLGAGGHQGLRQRCGRALVSRRPVVRARAWR